MRTPELPVPRLHLLGETGVPLRRITEEELRRTAFLLEKHKGSADFIEWGRKWYGPHAVRLHIHTDSEYDDQGGYYDTIDGIDAYDMLGHELPPDLRSAGVWDEVKDDIEAMVAEGQAEEDAINEVFYDMRWEWGIYDDLDAGFVSHYGHDVHIPSSDEEFVLPPIYVEETFDVNTLSPASS